MYKKLRIDKKTADALRETGICGYKDGREIFDPKPLAVPAELRGAETMEQKLQRIVQVTLARQASEQGFDTIEEAMDYGEDELGPDELPTRYVVSGVEIPVQDAIPETPANDAQSTTGKDGSGLTTPKDPKTLTSEAAPPPEG